MATITRPGRPDGVERRFRLASPVTATVLAGLTLVLLATAITLNGLTDQLSVLSDVGQGQRQRVIRDQGAGHDAAPGAGPIVPVVVIYAGVGVIVARRQPRNPIGWLLIIRVKSPVAVAVSTLVAAALFSPLRRRVQHAVDRRFNRARYDADEAVTAFAARLQDAVDLASVQDDLTGVVQRALEPTHVSVWLSPRG